VSALAIAHRGDPFAFRENTLDAFAAAVEAGADMVELDVWRTADGGAAVVHDPTLDRLWGIPRRVADLTSAELRALGVPDLAEALDAIPVQVMVDYKQDDAVEPALQAILAADALDRCVFAGECFDGHRRIRALHPDARIALTWTSEHERPEALLDELGAELFNPADELVVRDPSLVERMHARGTAVSVWTVDNPADMRLALDLGVDAVITNRIGELVALLGGQVEEPEPC
jgi:glycerophosphoryl diester phosphodiesterase